MPINNTEVSSNGDQLVLPFVSAVHREIYEGSMQSPAQADIHSLDFEAQDMVENVSKENMNLEDEAAEGDDDGKYEANQVG